MDDPLLPWWSVLLLGMWAIALTLWLRPAVHREVRLWAGLSTLVYLVLIFLALGGDPRGTSMTSSSSTHFGLLDIVLAVCVAVILTASIWMLGQVSLRCRQLCYLLLTLANAGACAVMSAPEVTVGLLCVAALIARPLVREGSGAELLWPRGWLADFYRFTDATVPHANRGEVWLIGGLGGVLACVFLGTISHSLRVETSRVTASPHYTALPSREQLDRILVGQNGSFRETALSDLALGPRGDVVVLMAIIVFLSLATTTTDPPGSKTARMAASDIPPPTNMPEPINER